MEGIFKSLLGFEVKFSLDALKPETTDNTEPHRRVF